MFFLNYLCHVQNFVENNTVLEIVLDTYTKRNFGGRGGLTKQLNHFERNAQKLKKMVLSKQLIKRVKQLSK